MFRLLKLAGLAALVSIALLVLGFICLETTLLVVESALPDVVGSRRFDAEIWKVSRVVSADGIELAEFYKERRTVVPFDELPQHLIDAVVAAEDKNFFRHEGVDYKAILRAAITDVMRQALVQGASTLTQQLARNLYLNNRKTLWRKAQEALLARKLEKTLSKNQILHQYLNLIYWGHGCYGVQEAARFYYDKDARRLTLPESILLAGIIRGPELLTPVRQPAKAKERMQYVIREMKKAGTLDESVTEIPFPRIHGRRRVERGLAPYGVDAAMVELKRHLPSIAFDRDGLAITTHINSVLQQAMNDGVESRLERLGLSLEVSAKEPKVLCDCISEGRVNPGCPVWARVVTDSRSREALVVDLMGRLAVVPHDAFTRLEELHGTMPLLAPGAYLKVMPTRGFVVGSPWLTEEIAAVPVFKPQVAAVLLDASTSRVVAMYGGVDHKYHPYNRALSAHRQVGSAIKPFVYLAALELLGWDPDTRVDSRPLNLKGADGEPWRIRDSHKHAKRLTITRALAYSSNTAAMRTLREIGVEAFLARWEAWGLPPSDVDDLSIGLGSASMSPLQLAAAYGLLANEQCVPSPTVVWQALTAAGDPVALPAAVCSGKIDPVHARKIKQMMLAVAEYGTGKNAALEGLEIAAKTGTTTRGRDAWFAGIVGHFVLVVWVGSDDYSPVEGNSGPTTAAGIWKAIASRCFL